VVARLGVKLFAMLGWNGVESLPGESSAAEPALPGALSRPDPPTAPPGPGVYLLLDAEERVLYLGKARSLQRRLAAYHRRQLGLLRRLEGLAAAVRRVETLPTTSELEALLIEARLLRRHQPPFNVQRATRPPALFLRADLDPSQATLTLSRTITADGCRYLGPFRTPAAASEALRLVRELFPGLKGRAGRRAAERRPLVQAALRFLAGQKQDVLKRLHAEQRVLAAAGDRVRLDASLALLRAAVTFSLDAATARLPSADARLLVTGPSPAGAVLGYVIQAGYLLACGEVADLEQARRWADAARFEPAWTMDPERVDEPTIVLRWLHTLGPEHRIARVDGGTAFPD
jgi:hypothetical protein